MSERWSRRDVVKAGAAAGAAVLAAPAPAPAVIRARGAVRPLALASGNGLAACATAVQQVLAGADTLDAAIAVLRRVADKTMARLRYDDGRPAFGLQFYCLNKAGEYAGASMYGRVGSATSRFAVNDGGESRLEDCAALFDEMPA